MPLYEHQTKLVNEVYAEWRSGAKVVIPQSPTGSGKTRMMGYIVEDFNDWAACIAHRRELVSQIAMALAQSGVRHRIVAPNNVVKFCARLQSQELGQSFVYPNAKVGVAGIDTMIRPSHEIDTWAKRCGLWNVDEGHHVLADNKWGRGLTRFRPESLGLQWTATPTRTDGKGLGRYAHGLADSLVLGPEPRWLIQNNYLSDYRIVCARDHIDGLKSGGSGEYTGASVDEAMRKSRIVGEVVPSWLKHAEGMRTVVFAHNLKAAKDIADDFIAAGVKAAVVSSKNSNEERTGLLKRFDTGDLTVLVNVDLFGEGLDVPGLECVVMARPTASLGLYLQQFGRVLRVLAGKLYGLCIDHVGNVLKHGLPDAHRDWTLNARPKRQSEGPTDAIPLRTCSNLECLGVYERIHKVCPYCGEAHTPAERSGPEHVDGDLYELDGATLARLRGESERFDLTPGQVGQEVRDKFGPPVAIKAAEARHKNWQKAQTALRAAIEQWSGYRKFEGLDDPAICRLFYFRFGVDIESARGLRKINDINSLTYRIMLNYISS